MCLISSTILNRYRMICIVRFDLIKKLLAKKYKINLIEIYMEIYLIKKK
jgi:hypothetical protein